MNSQKARIHLLESLIESYSAKINKLKAEKKPYNRLILEIHRKINQLQGEKQDASSKSK